MATFTMTVKELFERNFDFGLTSEDYPLFDEKYRGMRDAEGRWVYSRNAAGTEFYGLNRKIIDHFYYYEIGQETPDMFRFILNRTMREIMPYYNQLYATQVMVIDPFRTLEMEHKTTGSNVVAGETTEKTSTDGTGTSDSTNRAVNSTFPQSMLANNGDYASAATDTFGKGETTQATTGETAATTESTETTDRLLEMTGSQGSRAALLSQYRAALINVDLMVLAELRGLFMQVMETLDGYTSIERGIGSYGPSYNGFWPYL